MIGPNGVGVAAVCNRSLALLSAALFVAMCLPVPAGAQVQRATLEGTVVDSTGALAPGATVVLREPSTNALRSVTTDTAGGFRVPSLPPGIYQVRIELTGFAPYEETGIALAVGQTMRIRAMLRPSSVAETVEVRAAPSALESSRTSVATLIDSERIEELPVRSRHSLDFVLLAPGVTRAEAGVQPGGGAAAVPGSGFSVAGLRPRSNLVTIDGLDNNDAYSGDSRTELSPETVHEFQVITTGWSAESGGAAGMAVNVVTKSGTNTLHGDVFLFVQSGHLNARPKLEETGGAKPALARYRAGAAIGGPLRRDRTFYYAAAEREQTDREVASDIARATVSSINSVLEDQGPQSAGAVRLTDGLFPVTFSELEFSGKVTHQISSGQSVTVGSAGTRSRNTADAFNAGGLTDVSGRGTARTSDLPFTATWTAVVGHHATNELRGQVASRRVDRRTSDTVGPAVMIPGTAEFGRSYAGNDRHDHAFQELGDTFAWTHGRHFLKSGFSLTHATIEGTTTAGVGGLFVYPTIDALANRQPNTFRQVFGDPRVAMATTHSGMFLQNRWTPASPVTLDLGLRWDVQTLRPDLGIINHQVSPRLGVAWTPAAHWVFRGGAGWFSDRLVLASVERALTVDGVHGYEQIVDGDAAVSSLLRGRAATLTTPLPDVAPSIDTVRPGHWGTSSRQVGIGVERELSKDLTVALNYAVVHGHDLPRIVNVNLTPLEPGQTVFGPQRGVSAFDSVFELQPTASSRYRGLTMGLNRRLANEIEWAAAYTWSRATDTASDFDEQPQNPFDLAAEYGPSRYDQRHRLVASALIELGDADDRAPGSRPSGWARVLGQIEVAPILTIASGRVANPITGGDENRSRALPFVTRPAATGRNSVRVPATATLDLRVLKYFTVKPHGRLDVVVEVFNVMNRLNVSQLNPVYGPIGTPLATFRRPVDADNSRQCQFSIDFEF